MWDSEDVLSRLLHPLRLRGAYVSDWHLREGWGVRGDEEPRALLHYMRQGQAWVRLENGTIEHLNPGDVAIFPRGAAHVVAETCRARPCSVDRLLPRRREGSADVLSLGEGEPAGRMLCAGLDYEASSGYPLYQTLPDLLIARAADIAGDPAFAQVLSSLVAEVDRDTHTRAVLLRLFEMIYILGLRSTLAAMDPPAPISKALSDPALARVLTAMYEDYAREWSVEEFADLANMSRASFAARFKDVVGESPAQHLRRRRLSQARHLIETTNLSQETIARQVGYRSTVGLHLAFRREYDVAPGTLRRPAGARADPAHA